MDGVWLIAIIIAGLLFSLLAGFCDVPEDKCRLTRWLKEKEKDDD